MFLLTTEVSLLLRKQELPQELPQELTKELPKELSHNALQKALEEYKLMDLVPPAEAAVAIHPVNPPQAFPFELRRHEVPMKQMETNCLGRKKKQLCSQ